MSRDVAAVFDDVAEIDPMRNRRAAPAGRPRAHCQLALDGAALRVDDTGELDEQTRRPRVLTIWPGNGAPQPLFPRPIAVSSSSACIC
jgi:hypothetical protein